MNNTISNVSAAIGGSLATVLKVDITGIIETAIYAAVGGAVGYLVKLLIEFIIKQIKKLFRQ
jgi:hypothetical protein